jgi:hypothetical protein
MNAHPTEYQIELLHHTLGLSEQRRESYRNHFVAGNGHSDMRHLEELEQAGLMERRRTPQFLPDGDVVFAATDAGRALAVSTLPESPKLTPAKSRYEQYRDVSECYDSFAAFLGIPEVNFEYRDNTGHPDYRRVREYRMYRGRFVCLSNDLKGDWKPTMKEAKASYKAALKARASRKSA